MASVHDVVAYLLTKQGTLPVMRVQKLCYLSLIHYVGLDGSRLFPEPFEAWCHGPACRELYDSYKGQFKLDTWQHGGASIENLSSEEVEAIDFVINRYGNFSGQALFDHLLIDRGWLRARKGLLHSERGNNEIDISIYYPC